MGRRGYVALRGLSNVPLKSHWVFYLRLGYVMMRRRCYVLLRRHYDVPIRRHRDAQLRLLGDVPSRRFWVFHLRRTCDVTGTYKERSLRRCYHVLMPDVMLVMILIL